MPKGQHLQAWEVNKMTDMIAKGLSNKEIALDLNISPRTVLNWRTKHGADAAMGGPNGHAPEPAADVAIRVYVESTDYPEIKALIARQQRYRVMAKEAERMDDTELYVMLTARMELSPIEQEILRYWAETHAKDN